MDIAFSLTPQHVKPRVLTEIQCMKVVSFYLVRDCKAKKKKPSPHLEGTWFSLEG